MNKQDLIQLIREAMEENLMLKRYQDKLAVTSDLPSRKEQSQETFKNKNALKAAGFKWDSTINSWVIPSNQLSTAMKTINTLNKIEAFVEKVEDLQEFVVDADNLSKKDEIGQRIDAFIASLTGEVDEKAASEEIRKFMDFQAKIRSRSFHNSLMIYFQDKQATHVEGFRAWETKFGRRVMKGAKAITIFAPKAPKKKTDPEDDEEVDMGVKQKSFNFFMPVSVFDVRFTQPIPGQEHKYRQEVKWHADNTPNENAAKLVRYSKQLADEMGIRMTQGQDLGRGEQGYSAGGHINIASNVAGVNEAGTTIHEIAHELLHHKKESVLYIDPPPSKQDKEVQAESVSYIVLRHYDLPAQHQSTYLALWKANKDAIHKNLSPIKKAADFIITKIDAIAKDDVANNPQTGKIEVPRDGLKETTVGKEVNPKELLDLIKSLPDSESHIYQWGGKWEVTNEWLCGTFAGRGFTGDTPEEAAKELAEYLTRHIGHNSMVGDAVTKSGWPNLSAVKSYLRRHDNEEESEKDENN